MAEKLSIREKIAYALGDASANIAWRGVSVFLIIFYTDVFGIAPGIVATLLLVARTSDGFTDVIMGAIGDRTKTRFGKFRPWILWTAIPLGVILSLLYTCPESWSMGWKTAYAFTTYILFTLIYTANNIPYGALMAVMTGDDKERTSIGSFRMVGAFVGGMIVQFSLLLLVALYGEINPDMEIQKIADKKFEVTITSPEDVKNVNINTMGGTATFLLANDPKDDATIGKSFSLQANQPVTFIVEGEADVKEGKTDISTMLSKVFGIGDNQQNAGAITLINQNEGYSKAIYSLSIILVLCLFITFYHTRERVTPPATQKENIKDDLIDLIHNKPWVVLLIVGLVFNIYNNMKQGITVIYFTHYIHDQLLAGGYMTALMIASIVGAAITSPLSKKFGKKNLFIGALLVSGAINSLLYFCGSKDTSAIFVVGCLSECAAAIMPTLFFAMLGDAADYSEYMNGRRATGLVYSAGSFATKFGGGIAGAIIGWVLSIYAYNGQDSIAIQNAVPGIIHLMSWIPAIIALIGAFLMYLYPLNQEMMDTITLELSSRRSNAGESALQEVNQ